ncbi:MAG: M14 family zinc carboxypeptidase, partial [Erythrobacter sp.]|nr:M14 family zinc carboxypeptidase [Erythrobacter sp.]
MSTRYLLVAMAVMLGVGAQAQPPAPSVDTIVPANECRTPSAMIAFDFDGASTSACAILGEREFAVLVSPEHAPPINPSPWYAFRYESTGDAPVTITLRYLGGKHRYAPKWNGGGGWRELVADVADDGAAARLRVPGGTGVIAAQEVIVQDNHAADLRRWSAATGAPVFTLGQSHDGRPVEALRLGRADAAKLVVLLGRQHPPEVTGAIAMQAFVDELVGIAGRDPGLGADTQFLIVPLINPDGTAHGHWRANRGSTDLNRDWGDFAQPETRAVKAWLDALPAHVRPVLMIDFHSTTRNLFYVQGDEASAVQQRFLAA